MSNRFSLTEFFPDTPRITVVHAGAAMLPTLPEAYAVLVARGAARAIGFEPNPTERAKLCAAFGEGYTFLPHFIGSGGPATFYETNVPYTGSLLEPNGPLLECFQNLHEVTQLIATHPVTTHRLDDIPEVTEIDYLKIDVQGAELEAFKGGRSVLRECMVIETEVEFVQLYKGQPLFADVDAYLRSVGFQLHTFRNACSRCFKPLLDEARPNVGINQLLWADAVYVRDFMRLEDYPTEKLVKMAILVHDLYGSADLCLAILVEIDRRNGVGSILEDAFFARFTGT
jgi:FkbM family methyltransferase